MQFVNEVADVFEFAIDAGEADIGHLIQFAQLLHDEVAQILAVDFGVEVGEDLVLDPRDNRFQLFVAHRPLPAGPEQAVLDLFSPERFALAPFLDDIQDRLFNSLVGRKPATAMHALSPATE